MKKEHSSDIHFRETKPTEIIPFTLDRTNGPVIKSSTDNFGIEGDNLELYCSCDGLTSKNITWELPPIAKMV